MHVQDQKGGQGSPADNLEVQKGSRGFAGGGGNYNLMVACN